MESNEARIEAVRQTRKIASESLYSVLRSFVEGEVLISEAQLRDRWFTAMRRLPSAYSDGWYVPPPHGIGVLFGTENDYARMNYTSLRLQDNWPRDDIFLDTKTGIIYCYASPVDRKTGMIGDFGITIYFGRNPAIIKHLRQCLQLNRDIADEAYMGMTYGELTRQAYTRFADYGFFNEITSTTDPAGVNIGHTVPASSEGWIDEEMRVLGGPDWAEASQLISGRRIFLNTEESRHIPPGTACTLEPRLTVSHDRAIPMCSFHTILVISQEGKAEILTDFSDIFTLTGMGYMIE